MLFVRLNMFRFVKYFSLFLIIIIAVTSCGNKKFGDTRKTPVNALERAKKNVEDMCKKLLANLVIEDFKIIDAQ